MNSDRFTEVVFDFDGVLIDSNEQKLDCFREVAANYDPTEADRFLEHCRSSPSQSRFGLMEWLKDRLATKGVDVSKEQLLAEYADCVQNVYAAADRVETLNDLKSGSLGLTWSIVSAVPKSTLKQFLRDRDELQLFEGGVYGAPRSKAEIFREEYDQRHLSENVLFIGDSMSDHTVAEMLDIEFVFVTRWARQQHREEATKRGLRSYESVNEIFDEL